MNDIKCPSCGEMIPSDSRYCDLCGVELLECLNCGALGTDNFCAECGRPMVGRKLKAQEASAQADAEEVNKTVGGRRKSVVLKARKGGIVLHPAHEAVIGRKGGDYDHLLGSLDLISRRHGKFMQRGRDWYIVDFGSTNGTYVNDTELQPDVPVKFGVGDVVDIGTYIFDVVEQ